MPIYSLSICAELDGVDRLIARDDNSWCLDLECGSESREGVQVSSTEEIELEGSRGVANLTLKFPGKSKACSITVLPSDEKTCQYNKDQSGTFKVIQRFECRGGLAIVNWRPNVDFDVVAESGKTFEEIDISEKDWTDYDEDADLSVSVLNLQWKVELEKK